ncbi:MAG: carboxylesterase family protein [Eubacteriales bacterium]|nr:carboxylesterase family protein [Eubacteriales bacterium]
MKRKICTFLTILFICINICGCSEEEPAKAIMQAKAGINQEITGPYEETLAVKCHNGTFVGKKDGTVLSFKGVPYAEPPVGELRWKRPVPAAEREGVYEAEYFGKSPIQTEWFSEVGSYYLQGEDCLSLNVWMNTEGPAEGKTVMVFFHGGSYGWGGTSDPIYDGHNLVEKYPDLILVTAGYRTGIMGFIDFTEVPGGEDFADGGNLGLLDQICALQWVQKNIEAFGGDPGNVTIFGESAGGGSVSLLPLIEGTSGLFRRVIAESGSPALTYSREECGNLTEMLLEKSGCTDMDGLMALSEETLMELNEDLNDFNNFPERDGVILPEDLYAAWENEALADIDLMVGTNNDEMRYWISEMGHSVPLLPDLFVYEHTMPFMYENNLKRMSAEEQELTKNFVNSQSGKKIWKLTEFYNELLFRVPALEQAVRHKGKSYNYYWTMPGADETMGACHAIELAYVFNNPQETIYTGGLYNGELADTVQDMWVNFARSGDPGTEEYAWEPYTEDKRMTMVLGEEIGMVEDLKKEQREMIEPLLPHYYNGCYSQLDYMVPQLGRIIVQLLLTVALVIVITVAIVKAVKRNRKQ